MNRKVKGILGTLVVAFSLVGAGGTVAFATGGLILGNIRANYNLASEDLATIESMLVSRDTKITDLSRDLGASEVEVARLTTDVENKQVLINGLESGKTALEEDLAKANASKGEYEEQVNEAIALLTEFNNSIEETDGTKHKLEKALILIDDISTKFGTNVDLTELKETLKSAEQDNLDLDAANGLMENVKNKTNTIIEEYEEVPAQ